MQKVIDTLQIVDLLHHVGLAEPPFVEFQQAVEVVAGRQLLAKGEIEFEVETAFGDLGGIL